MIWLRHKLARRAGALLLVGLATGGCSGIGGVDFKTIRTIAGAVWHGGEKITLDEASSVPYASIGVSLRGSSQVMLILATDDADHRLWTSASGLAIMTRNGRIVRTAGFGYDLAGYQSQTDAMDQTGTRMVRWHADFPDLGLYSVPVICHDRSLGNTTIVLLGKDIHVTKIEERCRSESRDLDWSFTNTYWVDSETALMWRSIQHVHPRLDAIEIDVLRPPG